MDIILSRHINKNRNKLYEMIKDDIDNGNIVYIVVPEQFTLGTEIEIFNKFDLHSTLNLKIKSFKTIINEVLHVQGGRALNFISDNSKYLMIQMILLDNKEKLTVFQNNIYDKTFIDLVISFIDNLEENQIDIKYLENLIDKFDDELNNKLKDINLIINKFNELKNCSDYTLDNKKKLVIEKIKKMSEYTKISFYFDKFNDMSMSELEIVKEIEKIAKKTVLSITLDKRLVLKEYNKDLVRDFDVFESSLNFFNKLNNCNIENINILFNHDDNNLNNIEILTDNIFDYDINKVRTEFRKNKLENIFINRSNSTSEEIENLAINIRKDIINEKLKYSDIAILCTNMSEYSTKIKNNFNLNNIPYFIDQKRDLLDNRMIKYLKSVINLLNSNLSTISIIQFLKNSFLDINRNHLNIFQSYLQKRKIRGNMIFEDKYFSLSKIDTRYSDEDNENLEIIKDIRKLFVDLFENEEIKNISLNSQSIEEFTKLLYEFLSNEILMDSYVLYLKENGNNIDEITLIWDSFIETLDDLHSLNINKKIKFSEYCEILLSAIDNYKIGIIPPGQDNILIGDIKRSRFNKVKKLYVVGMSNLFYPILNNDNDIFLEDEKIILIENGIEINTLSEFLTSNDLLSFYTLLNSSEEKIVFSYSLINQENSAMGPASIIEWIRNVIPNENYILETDNYRDYIYSKTKISSYLPTKLRTIKNNSGNIDEKEKKYVYLLEKYINNKDEYRNINFAIELQNRKYNRLNLSKDVVEKIYNKSKYSVSQLEAFNSNPYNHFIKYGIKPREYENYNISGIDVGNIIHEFLSEYIRDIYNNEKTNFEDLFNHTTKKLIEDYKMDYAKNNFFISQMKEHTKSYSRVILKQLEKSNINNMYFEEKYGDSKTFPAIKLDIDGENINIEGKIDRVDEFNYKGQKYFRVVDYKTGNKSFDIEKVLHGIDLQLLLYLRAAIQSVEDGKPVGAFYQTLNNELVFDVLSEDFDIPKILKMNGIINDSTDLFEFIEPGLDLKSVSDSDIYSFFGRSKAFEKKNNVISEETFFKLFKYNENKMKETIRKIQSGNIELNPYMLKSFSPYQYSPYKTIDKGEGLRYSYLDRYSWEELGNMLEGEENDKN